MKCKKVLEIVLREMTAYGKGYRISWLGFDGRSLRAQLNEIDTWARQALAGEINCDFTSGTLFLEEKKEDGF